VGAKLGDAQRQRTDSAWSPTGPLQLLFDTQQAATADINGDGSIDIAAGVNTVDATASWAYLDKDGNTSFTPHSFFEGAINATDLGLSGGCISSFLAESRTSGSAADARLKDFAIGEFELCNIEVTQTGNTLGPVTDPVDYIITVTNTGAMPLFPRSINDVGDGWSGLGDLLNPANRTGIDDSVGGPGLEDNVLAIGETWTITASYTVKAGDPDPLKNTVTAIFSHDASDLLADTVSDSASHSVNLFQPAVDVQKSIIGNPTTVSVGDTIAFRFTITNTSDGDLNTPALDDLNGNTSDLIFDSISDPFLGDLTAKVISAGLNVLDFGETGFFDVPYTVQASDAPSLTNTVTVHYHPEAFPNDVTDTASVTLPVEQLRGRIVPAGTTPQQYIDFAINGTGGDPGDDDDFADGGFNYTTSGGKITNVSDPGTAFYYTVFTAPSSSFSVQVVQTATLGGGEMDLTSLQVLKAVGSAPTATGVVLVGNFSPLQVGTDSTVNLNSANLGEDPTGDLLVLRWRVQAKSIEGKPDPSQTYRLDFKTLVNNVQVDQDPDGILVIRSNPLHLAAPAVAYPTGEQLTHDGLQAAVDQAIASWRAAGVSPEALNGLRLLNFSIDNMLNNLLAWQSGNRIVIDADAGGCGYSTGRVDLLSVI
jgi:hypothetical protein